MKSDVVQNVYVYIYIYSKVWVTSESIALLLPVVKLGPISGLSSSSLGLSLKKNIEGKMCKLNLCF